MKINASIKITEGGKESAYDLPSDLSGEVTYQQFSEFVRNAIIKVSYDVLKEEQSLGRLKDPVILVDNTKKPIDQVKPFGEVFMAEKLEGSQILINIYSLIVSKSPIGQSKTYEAFNVVIVNNVEIARTMKELQDWTKVNTLKKGDFVRFVNLTPYASMLEREGISRGREKKKTSLSKTKEWRNRGIKVRVPNGTYILAQRQSAKSLKGNVRSSFSWINGKYLNFAAKPKSTLGPNNGKIRELRTNFSRSARNTVGRKIKGDYVYPSIVLTIV